MIKSLWGLLGLGLTAFIISSLDGNIFYQLLNGVFSLFLAVVIIPSKDKERDRE